MTRGPDLILKTRLSGNLVKIETMASGNNFGARYWTDGKCEAPMLMDRPWLRKNPASGELFWMDECEEVAEESPWAENGEYAHVPYAETPTQEDHEAALADGLAGIPEKELYLRLRCWWAANDAVREGGVIADPEAFAANLRAMSPLLGTADPNRRLLAAEVARQLGDFDTALELLTFDFPKDYELTVKVIINLVRQKESAVREVRKETSK